MDVETYCAALAEELRLLDGKLVSLTIANDPLTNSLALSINGELLTVNLLALVAAAAAYAFEQGHIHWRGH